MFLVFLPLLLAAKKCYAITIGRRENYFSMKTSILKYIIRSVVILSAALPLSAAFAAAALTIVAIKIDSTMAGPAILTATAPDFNNVSSIDSCFLTVDGVNLGLLTETGPDTGVFVGPQFTALTGNHSARVTCTNNQSQMATLDYTWTANQPKRSITPGISFTQGLNPDNVFTFKVAAPDFNQNPTAADNNCIIELRGDRYNGSSGKMVETGPDTNIYKSPDFTLSFDTYTAVVTCTDDLKATATYQQTFVLKTLDDKPPIISGVSIDDLVPGNHQITYFATDTISGLRSCSLKVDGFIHGVAPYFTGIANQYTYNNVRFTAGEHTFSITCWDKEPSPNTAVITKTLTFSDDAAPLSPVSIISSVISADPMPSPKHSLLAEVPKPPTPKAATSTLKRMVIPFNRLVKPAKKPTDPTIKTITVKTKTASTTPAQFFPEVPRRPILIWW